MLPIPSRPLARPSSLPAHRTPPEDLTRHTHNAPAPLPGENGEPLAGGPNREEEAPATGPAGRYVLAGLGPMRAGEAHRRVSCLADLVWSQHRGSSEPEVSE